MKRKRLLLSIVFLSILLAAIFLYQNRKRITGFHKVTIDSSLNEVEAQRVSIFKNMKSRLQDEYLGLGRIYFPKDCDEIYYFGKRDVYVYDQNYKPKYVVNKEQLSLERACSLGRFLGKYSGKFYFTVENNDIEDPDVSYPSDRIIEVSCDFQEPKSSFHSIGQYTSVAINKSKGHACVFRNDKGYYEIYDLDTKQYVEKVNVHNLESYYVHNATYNDRNHMILIGGGVGMKCYSGVISKDSLAIFGKSKDGCAALWGTDGKIYFNNKSTLSSYDPLTKKKNIVFSPGNFVTSGIWVKLAPAPQNKNVIIFDYTSDKWLRNVTVFGRLILDVDKQEYINLILGNGKKI